MSIRERFRFWYLRARVLKMTKKMDFYIHKLDHHKACLYEDMMYTCDDELVNFSDSMYAEYS